MEVSFNDESVVESSFILSLINSLTISGVIQSIISYEDLGSNDNENSPVILWEDIFECTSIEC